MTERTVTHKTRLTPQTSVAIPPDLLTQVRQSADANTRTLSQEIVHALRCHYGRNKETR